MPQRITATKDLVSRLEKGEIVDCELIELDCSQLDLEDAVFVNCHFKACNFRAAKLNDATFTGCTFFDAESETTCDFSYAKLRGAVFERCDLTTVPFERISAYGLRVIGCNAQGAGFHQADVTLSVEVVDAD
ncbi:MAG: pentapeptide repeat-containing protein, partial [Gammaproteobacteria bacterium]|nr:pentapeptide repeat-containing protein [Gammaproteobacteria bacterium]